jgi:pyrroline-5-carboxylate reductase
LKKDKQIAILGAGNIGMSIATGLVQAGTYKACDVFLTRRRTNLLKNAQEQGFSVLPSVRDAVKTCRVLIMAVEPQQVDNLLGEIGKDLIPNHHVIISIVTGVSIRQIAEKITPGVAIVRAMPNTAIAERQSMTCLSSQARNEDVMALATEVFEAVGKTLVIEEEQMHAATALGACGIAFFLRAIRAASQGGIEVGFHSADALLIAAQTAKGAASLLLSRRNHPESEIDRVTTPRGCTIAGLNRMEHEGFSSAMIKGIVTSADIAARLYVGEAEG